MAEVHSLFAEYIDKAFPQVVAKVTEKINDRNNESKLIFKEALDEELSVDMRWDSNDFNDKIFVAEVVAMDSSLPLRKRGVVSRATGTIAKQGVKYSFNEKQISDLTILKARGEQASTIAAKVLNDVPRVIKSIEYANEVTFEQGLSTGQASLPYSDGDDKKVVRVSYAYPSANITKASKVWTANDATPITDLREKIFDKADADDNEVKVLWISKTYLNLIRKSAEGKELAANYAGQVIVNVANLPLPTTSRLIAALKDEFSLDDVVVVDSHFKSQDKDGKEKGITGWATGNVVGTSAKKVGRLVYSRLVEEDYPTEGVSYQKSGKYILVSKWATTDPKREFTGGQAICVPVIDNPSSVYVLQADKA